MTTVSFGQSRAVRYLPRSEWVPELMAGLTVDLQTWLRERPYPGPVIAALADLNGLVELAPA